jgi:MFS transporter, PAT family, beta-lactamase induction signal transducer AmpG
MKKRLIIVFMLGFSSGMPLALLTTTLQAWFSSDGLSLMSVGFLSLIGLPYSYRFLWAPLLDRITLFHLGRRRDWLLLTQIVLFIGFNIMACLSPKSHSSWMILLGFVLAFISATQDIAVDAQRTEYLSIENHALGASLGILGYRCALLISGGVSLVIANYWGWVWTYHFMALGMLVGVCATLYSKEPVVCVSISEARSVSLLQAFFLPAKELFSREKISFLLFFVMFYKVGEAFTASTSGIVLPFLIQGLGFPLDVIGYVNKIAGVTAAISGGLVSGFLLRRWQLFRAMILFGLMQSLSILFFIILATIGRNTELLCIAVIIENFSSGLCAVALVTLFMRVVDRRYTATQLSLLMAFAFLPRTFSGPIAAAIQKTVGWTGMYEIIFFVSLGFIPILLWIYRAPKLDLSFRQALH